MEYADGSVVSSSFAVMGDIAKRNSMPLPTWLRVAENATGVWDGEQCFIEDAAR